MEWHDPGILVRVFPVCACTYNSAEGAVTVNSYTQMHQSGAGWQCNDQNTLWHKELWSYYRTIMLNAIHILFRTSTGNTVEAIDERLWQRDLTSLFYPNVPWKKLTLATPSKNLTPFFFFEAVILLTFLKPLTISDSIIMHSVFTICILTRMIYVSRGFVSFITIRPVLGSVWPRRASWKWWFCLLEWKLQ